MHSITLGTLKQEIYKALEIDTVNGDAVSSTVGVKADMENRILSVINRCVRRIARRFPLLIKTVTLTVTQEDDILFAVLPTDAFEVTKVSVAGREHAFTVLDGKLYAEDVAEDDTLSVVYGAFPALGVETALTTAVVMPGTTLDALILLAATELCPVDNTELYAKLMSQYNGLLYEDHLPGSRKERIGNTFFRPGAGKGWRL